MLHSDEIPAPAAVLKVGGHPSQHTNIPHRACTCIRKRSALIFSLPLTYKTIADMLKRHNNYIDSCCKSHVVHVGTPTKFN